MRVDYPIERIVGLIVGGEVRPGVDGHYDPIPNLVAASPDGDGTIVIVRGQTPGYPTNVWFHVIG